jgi:hypothetical protein
VPRAIGYEKALELARVWESCASRQEAFDKAGLKTNHRAQFRFIIQAREMTGYPFPSFNWANKTNIHPESLVFSQKKPFDAIFFTDQHYCESERYPAHDILLQVIEDTNPKVLINGGDSLNGGQTGRFGKIGWEMSETPFQEYEATKRYLGEVEDAAPKAARFWTLGNHDIRHETVLANHVPQMEHMPGSALEDLFPQWRMGWLLWVNRFDKGIAGRKFKHRWHSGVHSAYNNTLRAGVNICTGHTHKLVQYHVTDDNGVRDAVEGGTIANPFSPVFHYLEGNPGQFWVQGFVVFHFMEGDSFAEFVRLYERGSKYIARFRGKTYSS